MKALRKVMMAALFAGALGACAPLATSTAVREAEVEVKKAEEAGAGAILPDAVAAQTAPYLYWQAHAMLIKAKQTEGYSEFEQARLYAVRAKDYAIQSVQALIRERAERVKSGQIPAAPAPAGQLPKGATR